MTINERIKQLRLDLGLSQARFAQDISVSAGYIASIELGNRRVNDRIIKLICTQYNINEPWLRSGEGEMRAAYMQEKELAEFFGSVLSEPDSFRAGLMRVLAGLNAEEWLRLEEKTRQIFAPAQSE